MGIEDVEFVEVADPSSIQVDEEATVVAYIGGDGQILHEYAPNTEGNSAYSSLEDDFEEIQKSLRVERSKFHDMSRQSHSELGESAITSGITSKDVINPPYPPKCLANFLEIDPVFFRAVKAKVLDSVGREYQIQPKLPVKPEGSEVDDTSISNSGFITTEEFRTDFNTITEFVDDCNDVIGFRGILERAAMDYEAIGWAGLEVIRSQDGIVRKLEHIPAQRLRVLKGFSGFCEITSDGDNPNYGRFYQKFGQKFMVKVDGALVPFDASKHEGLRLVPNFVKFTDGQPTQNFNESANEVLYIPKHHSNTIYYGYSDIIPALGCILANVYIRDYILQFFEHNTIPRYAVIIKGAKIDEEFRKSITEYFSTHVKGAAHKTLILTLQGMAHKDVTIEFEKLDTDQKEADFLLTRKANNELMMTSMGTSPAILGVADNSELGSGKGLSQAEIYKDRIVDPCQRHWADKLNLLFRRGIGIKNAVLKFDPLDIRDMLLEMQYITGLQDRGDVTVNEVRKFTGMGEPLEGGDHAFRVVKESSLVRIADIGKIPMLGQVPTDETPKETPESDEDNEDQEVVVEQPTDKS